MGAEPEAWQDPEGIRWVSGAAGAGAGDYLAAGRAEPDDLGGYLASAGAPDLIPFYGELLGCVTRVGRGPGVDTGAGAAPGTGTGPEAGAPPALPGSQ